MNPVDALPADYRRYYNLCWMKHKTKGIGCVFVADNQLFMYMYPNDIKEDSPTRVEAVDLSCWWPRPGAYNTDSGAVYISRKAARTMRKSATPGEHYTISFGRPMPSHLIMLELRKGPQYHNINFANKILLKGLHTSIAITRDIILAKGENDQINLLFKGQLVGEYREGEFIPNFEGSPLAKRVLYKLEREESR